MYSSVQLTIKYIKYLFTSSNAKGHGVHSPFVFDFITNVLNDRRQFYAYQSIENIRSKLFKNDKVLTLEDYGAGSLIAKTNNRKISTIARSSLKPRKFSQLMFRIVNYYKTNTILELGTSLGITSSYFASANLQGHLYTFEGAKQVAELARQHFKDFELNNISIIEGNFDDTLQPQLNELQQVDLAFVDGNHRKEPTLSYFHQMLEKATEDSIFIFDDIHWSRGMEDAWKAIQLHPSVTLTIDLFFIGLVFFRKEQKVPQHFSIRF